MYVSNITRIEAASAFAQNTSRTLPITVNYGMTIWECLDTTHVCFWLRNAVNSTYKEADYSDNVKCFLLGQVKDCEPGKKAFKYFLFRMIYGKPTLSTAILVFMAKK